MEEILEVIQLVPQDGIQQRIVEEIIDVPVPEVMEKTGEVGKHVRQGWMQSYTAEQIVGRRCRERRAVHRDGTHVAEGMERNEKLNDMLVVRGEVRCATSTARLRHWRGCKLHGDTSHTPFWTLLLFLRRCVARVYKFSAKVASVVASGSLTWLRALRSMLLGEDCCGDDLAGLCVCMSCS